MIERDRELEEMRDVLAAGRAGRGAAVVVEAPAGQGKTALLRALRGEALAAGHRVLTAVGAELERDFPFGAVRQLLEPDLHSRDEERRTSLFDGAAKLARPVFEPAEAPETATDASFTRLHGLYWLVANLAAEQPLVLIVDDAHWTDGPSMRFFDVLARRLEGLPLVLAMAARPSEPALSRSCWTISPWGRRRTSCGPGR